MDKLAAMRAFVEIVDRGSLTAAAAALDRSLPTVVRTLAMLEGELGARLLQRTTRRMSLTDEGRDYLERCRRILADVEEAERALAGRQREPAGPVRLTAPVLFGQMHVAAAVLEFVQRHARVQVELLLLDRVVNLVEEGVDLALRIGTLPDSTSIAVTVGRMRRVLCASPQLLERDGVPGHPDELETRPCVRFRGLATGDTWSFHAGGRERAVRVAGAFACNQASVAVEACAAGLGFGLFLAYQVEPLVRAGALRVVLEDFEPPPVPVSLVRPQGLLVPLRVRTLLEFLAAQLRARPTL